VANVPDAPWLNPKRPEQAPGPEWTWVGTGKPTDRHPRGAWVHRLSGAALRPHVAAFEDEVVAPIPDDDLVFAADQVPAANDAPANLMQTSLPPGASEFVLESLAAGHRLARQVARRIADLPIGTMGLLPAGVSMRRARYFNFGLLREGDPSSRMAEQWVTDALADPTKLPWDALIFEDPARKGSFPALQTITWPLHRHGNDVYYSLSSDQRSAELITERFRATIYTHQTRGFWLDLSDGTQLPAPGTDFDDATIDALAACVKGGWVDVYDRDLVMFWKVV
jgi:hypothetical protein